MARVSRPDQDPNADPNAQDPNAPTEPADPTQASAAPAPAGSTAPSRPRFNDISRLLYANQGQGQKLAQGAIAGADQAAAGANQQLAQAQQSYNQQVAAATPKAYVAPNLAPPKAAGTGGLTGRGAPAAPTTPTLPILPGSKLPTPTAVSPSTGGGWSTTQSNINATPDIPGAQAAAAATYTGPNSLNDAKGVDLTGINAAYDRAEQQYQTLAKNPSLQGGGAGAFNDFLANAEGGQDLRAASQRFSGLRDQLARANTNTGAADAAKASVAASAKSANDYITGQHDAEANATANQAAADRATEVKKTQDDEAFARFMQTNAFAKGPEWSWSIPGAAGTAADPKTYRGNDGKIDWRAYFDANRNSIGSGPAPGIPSLPGASTPKPGDFTSVTGSKR